jgi:hypothetical protein
MSVHAPEELIAQAITCLPECSLVNSKLDELQILAQRLALT